MTRLTGHKGGGHHRSASKSWIAAASALLGATACTATGSVDATQATPERVRLSAQQLALLDSHVRGFAQSYCLRSLDGKGLEPAELAIMRQQGQRWTGIVIQRSFGDIDKFLALIPVVDEAIAVTGMAFVRNDKTGDTVAAPAYYCASLINREEVQTAIEKAKLDLTESYLAA